MPEINDAAIPRRDAQISVLGLEINVSFALGAMALDDFDYFKKKAKEGNVLPEEAMERLVAMRLQWDLTKDGKPIPVTMESLRKNVPTAFPVVTLLGVMDSLSPKETTPSTSPRGSKRTGTGVNARGTKKGRSSRLP